MNSLRKRFTIWSLSTTAILAAIAGLALYFYVSAELYRDFDAGLRTRAQLIGSLLRIEDNGKYGMDFSDESMPQYLPGNRPEYFQVMTSDGKILDSSQSLKSKNLVLATNASSSTIEPWNMVLPNGRPGRAIAMMAEPHMDADDHDRANRHESREQIHLSPAMVIVAQDRSQINHTLERLLPALLLAGLILAIGSIIGARLVVWQALIPVNELARHAEDVGPENLDYRFDIAKLPTELQLIGQRLNELLERLDQAFHRERRLNADIAHELRTPIAELRALTDMACRWPTDVAQVTGYFSDAHSIAVRMGSLIEALLTLSRNRANLPPPAMDTIVLNEIIEESFSIHQSAIAQRGLSVAIKLLPDCLITTNHLIFAQIIGNIVSNSVNYTPEGGRIECKGECAGGQFKLTLGNSNDSLTAEDLREIFDPFWRKDGARAGSEHRGLGLALVAEYAKQLGIIISTNLELSTWFELILAIPAANTPSSPHVSSTAQHKRRTPEVVSH